jgi:hypothetical protein
LTPILTQEIADEYFSRKITPITIYSETIPGNPLNADFVVRYLMNFVGQLGGETEFDSEEYIISYSASIGRDFAGTSTPPPSLFLPAIDPRDFTFNEEKENFQITYAAKYRLFVGEPPKVGELKNIEILRDGPKRQERALVSQLISKASVAYVFENTAIVIESILSGTPVVLVKNSFFDKIIADEELGLTIMDSGKALRKVDVSASREKYYDSIDTYFDKLERFAQDTQKIAIKAEVKKPILVPGFSRTPLTLHRARLAFQIYKNLGLRALSRVVYYFILRRVSRRFFLRKARRS